MYVASVLTALDTCTDYESQYLKPLDVSCYGVPIPLVSEGYFDTLEIWKLTPLQLRWPHLKWLQCDA
jgi:hypothetical protein